MSKLRARRVIFCVPSHVKKYASRVRKSAVGGANDGTTAKAKATPMQHISKPRERGVAERKQGTAENKPARSIPTRAAIGCAERIRTSVYRQTKRRCQHRVKDVG